jgi:hypothetical protein
MLDGGLSFDDVLRFTDLTREELAAGPPLA